MIKGFFKTIVMVMLAILLVPLCGCKKAASLYDYKSRLTDAAEEFKLELHEDEQYNLKYSISPLEGGTIIITLYNEDAKDVNAVSSFTVEYTKNLNEDDFNVKLFVALVNSVSKKDISEGYCCEFINAPEDRFPSSRYNHIKQEGELTAKWQALNFFEDWMLKHMTYSDGHEMLSFGGMAG